MLSKKIDESKKGSDPDENDIKMGECKEQPYSEKQKKIKKSDKKKIYELQKNETWKQYFDQEEQIMESHIPYNCISTKSPYILINKWFYRLQKLYSSEESMWNRKIER